MFAPRAQKPSNVLADDSVAGKLICRVCDLGLAAEVGADGVAELRGGAGTRGFRCPLVGAGARAVGPAADVFSWGRLLRALADLAQPADGPLPVRPHSSFAAALHALAMRLIVTMFEN